MKIKLISFVLIILLVDHIVYSGSYNVKNNIVGCSVNIVNGQRHLKFNCVYSIDPKDSFVYSSYGIVKCSNSDYFKTGIDLIDFDACYQPKTLNVLLNGYWNLQVLNVSNLGLENLSIYGFEKLTKFITSHNEIMEIPADAFSNASQLIEVDLSINKIDIIHKNAFAADNQVEILNLSHNKFNELSPNTFYRLTKLKKLLMSQNQIIKLPSFLFLNCKELVEIDFSYNLIEEMDIFTFSGNFSLKKINLSHNQLLYFDKAFVEDHSDLEYLNISNNRIKVFDSFESGRNLVSLDLSGNFIMILESMEYFVNLKYLNLSENKIVGIMPGTFLNQENLEILDLSNNKITTLSLNIFTLPLDHLKLLSIGNNQLHRLNGFTEYSIPNTKIAGLDSNKFDCSYLKCFFRSITWQQLDSIPTRIKCIPVNDTMSETSTLSEDYFLGSTIGKMYFIIFLIFCMLGFYLLISITNSMEAKKKRNQQIEAHMNNAVDNEYVVIRLNR